MAKWRPISLVVGVTGHRDIRPEDRPRLIEVVGQVMERLRADLPRTALTVVSPLAPGADQLVARWAVEHDARLVVPLPMERAEYERDFDDPAERREFHELLARADAVTEMPLVEGNSSESIRRRGPARDMQYVQAGAYVARNSHWLLALWDGDRREPAGGTAQIVRFALEGFPAPYAPARSGLDPTGACPVVQIVTPRRRNPVSPDDAFAVAQTHPPSPTPHADPTATYRHTLERLDTFNADAEWAASKLKREIEASAEQLLSGEQSSRLESSLRQMRLHFAQADTLAMSFRKKRHRVLIGITSLGMAAIGSFVLYDNVFMRNSVTPLALYCVLVLLALLYYRITVRRGYQSKHLDYRALAEGLRIQFFWRLAGLDRDVADHFLFKQWDELDWIRQAIRTCSLGSKLSRLTKDDEQQRMNWVLNHWVRDQETFFARSTRRDDSRLRHRGRISTFLVGLSFMLALALLLGHILSGPISAIQGPVIIAMAMSFALAGALESYLEKTAVREQASQYARAWALFARAGRAMDELMQPSCQAGPARRLIFELGLEALEDNGAWLMVHRSRPLEVPSGG